MKMVLTSKLREISAELSTSGDNTPTRLARIIQSDSAEKWPNREQIALNANSTALGCLRV